MVDQEVRELRWSLAVVADPQGPYRDGREDRYLADAVAGRAVYPVS